MCSTLSQTSTLTHESMLPNSASVCIHSVCVSKALRRRGVALALLREYVNRLEKSINENDATYERILLLTHEELRTFYEMAGFVWSGPSNGFQAWFEMHRDYLHVLFYQLKIRLKHLNRRFKGMYRHQLIYLKSCNGQKIGSRRGG